MGYDDNEFQGQNLQLTSVLHPKFEFDDSLLSLVENEVFLGITSEEDNQWIEEYSCGGIELSSSSKRRDNVWSEATRVEMLIKSSVGQKEETIINICGSLTKIMDPSLNQDDGELGSVVVLSKDCNLSVSEAEESMNKELPEGLKVQKQEVSAADKDNNSIMIIEKSQCDVELSGISIPFNEPSQELKDNNMHEEEGSLAAAHSNSVLNVDSLSKIKNPSAHQITSPETGSTHVDCKCALRHADQDGSLSLPLETSDVDIDNQKNVEPSLSVEDSKDKTPNFESHVLDRVDQVAAMESDGSRLLLSTPETDDQPKSLIFGVSLVHQEKVQVGFPCDCDDNVSLQIQSVVASSSPDMAEKIDSHCTSLVENCNANQIEIEPESNTNTSKMSETDSLCESSEEKRGNSCVAGGPKESVIEEVNKHQAFVDVDCPSKCDIGQDGGSFSSLEKPQLVSQSAKDKQETTNDDSPLPCKTTDDDIQPVSSSKATQEEKNLTFEVNTSADKSYPTFQVSMAPRIVEGPSRDSSSGQVDARISNQIGVKGKSVRKSVGRKDKHLKGKTLVRVVEESSVLLTPPATATGQVIQSNENAERSCGGVLPDLNNSTTPVFQQPFTDNQQVQLRAQILVYGSLISGSLPEETHMIASFGKSDGGRSWEGVWRAWHHVKKAQAIADTQSRSFDRGVKQASFQNNNAGIPSDDGKMMEISSEETLSKVEESKIQAADAAERAAAAVSHCHGVWRQLERHNCSDGDDEAKLVSSAVSVAAAASVAKVAAAAAKIASDVAEQARSVVNLFLLSNKTQNFDKPAIAASENLDAIVKAAAEMAAEAVSEAGKIVAMSEPLPLRHLVEAGPEGYWKSAHPLIAAGSLNGKEKENHYNERKPRVVRKDLSKTTGVAPKSVDTCIAGQSKPEAASDNSKENNNIKEGCLVEGQEKRMKLESCEQKLTTQTQTLPLSTQETLFGVGKEGQGQGQGPGPPRGAPKPGKKQKFMDVSKHHHHHDSVKFTRYLIPQAPAWAGIGIGIGMKNNNNSSRKPPIPSFKSNKTESDQQNQMKKRKFVSTDAEPSRRSNRRIQPTSRLLEGLQTSITVSKIPAFTHTKGTPKDNTNKA